MPIEVSVAWGDSPRVTIAGATAADFPQPLTRIIRAVAGMELGTLSVDPVSPDGVYDAKVARAGGVLSILGRAP